MRSDPVIRALRDMVYQIDLAESFAAGVDFGAFCNDLRMLYAVTLPRNHLRSLTPIARRAQGTPSGDRVDRDGRGRQRLPSRLRGRGRVLRLGDPARPLAAAAGALGRGTRRSRSSASRVGDRPA